MPGKVGKLDDLLAYERAKKDKVLELGETAFLKKFSKNIKKQITEWASKTSNGYIEPIDFNFDEFYDHAFLMEIMAYIKASDDTIEFAEEINPFEMKFQDAISYALSKNATLFEELDTAQEKSRERAFWVKRSTDITVTEKLMKDLQKSLETGGTYKEWLADIGTVADRCGMGEDGYYSSMVYRTNMMSFYNAGHYTQQKENEDEQPYWLYDGIGDDRQSDICKELDGKVYKSSDAIWSKIYPPNHFFCRSSVVALSTDEVEAYGLKINKPTKKIKEMDIGSFEGNPADSYWKKLEKDVIIKEEKTTNKLFPLNIQLFGKEHNLEVVLKIIETLPKKIHEGRQGKHMIGHNNYLPGRSYFSSSLQELQELVDKYAGTGKVTYTPNNGQILEQIKTDKIIGINVDEFDLSETETKCFKIHYSKKGLHIVPMKGDE